VLGDLIGFTPPTVVCGSSTSATARTSSSGVVSAWVVNSRKQCADVPTAKIPN